MLSKYVNNTKCAPKLIFFNEKKKLKKNQLIFDKQNKQLDMPTFQMMCDQITEPVFQAFHQTNQKTRANSETAGTLHL